MNRWIGMCMYIWLASMVFATEQETKQWPQWRGEKGDGIGITKFNKTETGLNFKLVWKKELGSGYSSISIAQGKAVTMFSDGTQDNLIALNAETGQELWRVPIAETYKGHSGSHDGTLSTPAISEGLVFALGPKGQLLAVNLDDGSKVWGITMQEFESHEPEYGWTTSPLVVGDMLIIQTGGAKDKSITAFDKKTGKILWSAEKDAVDYQSPILANIHGKKQIISVGNEHIYGLNPKDGRTMWSMAHAGDSGDQVPVVTGENQIFLPHAFAESMFIEVSEADGTLSAKEVWKTREIKGSNDTSVYHDGYIYGYSRQFMTCIDAKTGERKWRSRAPGDGFTIMADDHLVTITKRGMLHLAKANPTGYEDMASLKIFDGLGWNPPSLANSKIYVRNLAEIACVALVPADAKVPVVKKAPELNLLKGSEFTAFVKKVQQATDKKALVDTFMAEHKASPVIEKPNRVHMIYRGEVEDIAVQGDMLEAGESRPLDRVPGTDLYFYSFELDSDAHICYSYLRNFEERISDPLNPIVAEDFQGPQSVLQMPGWKDSGHLKEPQAMRGSLESFEFESKVLENKRQIRVYLPPGYAESTDRYPTLYSHYGAQAVERGLLARSADNIIGKTIDPVILVFVHLNETNSYNEVSGDLKDKYAEMLATELVPFIDKKYRTVATPDKRGSIGVSAGGFISIYTALKHPGVFGWAVGQSTNLDNPIGPIALELIEKTPKVDTNFYLNWGTYDLRREDAQLDRAAANRNLVPILEKKGYKVFGGERKLGYGWGNWRTNNDEVLETLFPLSKN